MKKQAFLSLMAASLILGGCASTGDVYRADVYRATEVNRQQEVQSIEIIAVQPARIAVPNTDNRGDATTAGMIIGALAGAAVGAIVSDSPDAVIAGGVAGGALGNLGGKAAGGQRENLVDGVQITYRIGNRIYNSAQVGKVCEFMIGPALLIKGKASETRVQPNNPYGCTK